MAHAGRDTGGSQILPTRKKTRIEKGHTCFGKVTEGLDVIDDICEGEREKKGKKREIVRKQIGKRLLGLDQEPKTFGTFGGVFTPTLLTILGVIMYLRLGWVVGNAGLLGAWLIIILSFTITLPPLCPCHQLQRILGLGLVVHMQLYLNPLVLK